MFVNVFKADLRVTSKAKALEFYKGIKGVTLIPCDKDTYIRVEPGCCISFVSKKAIDAGTAPFIPALCDEDGSKAYELRKYINAYLSAE